MTVTAGRIINGGDKVNRNALKTADRALFQALLTGNFL